MKIRVYSIMRNERVLIPYFIQHYRFAEKIVVFDDGSNDGTREILQATPIIDLRTPNWEGIDDFKALDFWEACRKEALAAKVDWVIMVDGDEFLWGPWSITGALDMCLLIGCKVLQPEAWQMIGDSVPAGTGQIYDEIKFGVRDPWYDKAIAFKPEVEMKFEPGRHGFSCDARVHRSTTTKLLHYRYLGEEYYKSRSAEHEQRLTQSNRQHSLGTHVCSGFTGHQSLAFFKEMRERRVRCLD